MKCPLCSDPVPAWDQPRKAHVAITKDAEDHLHTHGDLDHKDVMRELLEAGREAIGLPKPAMIEPPAEVVFRNRQRIGDTFMFTCGVRDFKKAFPKTRVNVVSIAPHIWDHNPYLDRTLEVPEDRQVKIGPQELTNRSNTLDWHFANAYRVSMEKALGVVIPQGESRADLWFTEEEYHAPRVIKEPYWLICVNGELGWGCKMYPFERWQEVVKANPDLTFVQIGAREDKPPRLQGPNVIDYVGQTQNRDTGIRDLFKLFLNAEGSLGLVSFHMHLSGALYKPCVVIAGGREPVSFTRYAGHQYLANDGTMPCSTSACWHCDINACTNLVTYQQDNQKVPRCVDIIEPREVTEALRRYYLGGRLTVGQVSAKPPARRPGRMGIGIVPTPPKPTLVPVTETTDWQRQIEQRHNLTFGKGSIDPQDWPYLEQLLHRHQVKTVLEFGAGLSTLLFAEHAQVTSFETEAEWIERITSRNPNVSIQRWNGRQLPEGITLGQYDLAFVDGPANGQNRGEALRLAANHAKIVVVHDGSRVYEQEHQAKYMSSGFEGPIKGGRWCWVWLKAASFQVIPAPPPKPVNPAPKRIKIVTTARGWGGAQRSITTIMKLLLERGHHVEFIPFRNQVTSREFIDRLKNGLAEVTVSDSYDSVRESCDTLLVYADDYVWEFAKPEIADIFGGIQAAKRVMMVNYRRGGIGEIEWTRGWDRYLFLNSGQEREFLGVQPEASTGVLPPCTDLTAFLEAGEPDYGNGLRVVRHNSQGDTKFTKDGGAEIMAALAARADLQLHMMPGPSFVPAAPPRFVKYPKNTPPIHKFLQLGNLFWYSLPEGYMDMGPRVIIEAMASGLAVVADPWGGAPDRVTPECGWIVPKAEQLTVLASVTAEELAKKGRAARERAVAEFVPERWLAELVS